MLEQVLVSATTTDAGVANACVAGITGVTFFLFFTLFTVYVLLFPSDKWLMGRLICCARFFEGGEKPIGYGFPTTLWQAPQMKSLSGCVHR